MQGTAEMLKFELWNKLKVIFDKYADETGEIKTDLVQKIAREVLGETNRQEIDYIIKNMFRVDPDGSGTVSFLEFGNFLFKRHCGQMSLQRMHRQKLISHGSQSKITRDQFYTLINNAYSFLGVKADNDLVSTVFKEADKDGDSLITYVQYFQFIQKYVCQTKAQFAEYQKSPEKVKEPEPVPVPVDLGKEWNSRVRLYIWLQLRLLYESCVLGKKLTVNQPTLRNLIRSILGQISEAEITFLLTGLLKLNKTNLQFVPFAIIFINLVAELGLSRYQRNHDASKKTLTAQEFLILFRNSFKFLNIGRIRKQILLLIFALIDKNNDGLISFNQYLDWVKRFLAVEVNRGDEFYIKQDDEGIAGGDVFEAESPLQVLPNPHQNKLKRQTHRVIKFEFSNWDLSDLVRKRVWQLLVQFDKNKDKKFDEPQIRQALTKLLKQNQHQLQYVVKNVFRYDVDGDKSVTYDQLTNFCVQQHFGQMAIQRLHRVKSYSRGHQRIMNEKEFGITLNNALAYINLSASPQQISLIFKEIDLQKSGWITYEVYFLFLRYYFGSLRGTGRIITYDNTKDTTVVQPVDPDKQWYDSLSNLSALDRFIRLLLDQLKRIFLRYDYNKNLLFEQDEIEAILSHVFGLNASQINYILLKFFNFANRANKSLTFEQLVKILLEIYFVQIILKRKYKDLQSNQWKARKISLQEFIELVLYACAFLNKKPTRQDLTTIFKLIDTDNDGFITFAEYVDFIRKYLGLGIQPEIEQPKPLPPAQKQEQKKPEGIDSQEWQFILQIWSELKAYFDKYDSGSKGYLTQQDLKRFVMEVLHETSQRELDYVFWNLFRVDPNKDRKTQFHEFAPFILMHAGQIALQRFHKEQTAGKNALSEKDLFVVFSNAFSFLSTMPKSQGAVKSIYCRIGKGSNPSYSAYVGWINKALASKFRK